MMDNFCAIWLNFFYRIIKNQFIQLLKESTMWNKARLN